ncbi:MAG: hypothetical protein AVDCRST_MAG70-1527 [uncultured Thermomicrobiales bacterium]|uniref:Uncharacterized protein n=1 Tax=uncultured Thermomicrobiales bacterium TaxID=1645740 RepID=A0A6J4UV06_9BACT|nr:MAG: hypothetical protein AVDCRST_MAG70-1527 [uncultured Thermomicrobiales bacterium]
MGASSVILGAPRFAQPLRGGNISLSSRSPADQPEMIARVKMPALRITLGPNPSDD